jgi:hypothetical protein
MDYYTKCKKLTEEEQKELDELINACFLNWNRAEYEAFMKAI